ncbi:MAG: hypothetical protein PHH28_07940 [Desulfuromonadaceae bacterium]|nr:hypothetical protein [Desulfuromonadaceae bacterium]
MKMFIFIPSVALGLTVSIVSLVYAFESEEGKYTNDKSKITIIVQLGNRGGTEFLSSKCKGKVFKPPYTGVNYIDEKAKYAIGFGGDNIHMDIEGENKCLPEGRYKRISN